MGDTGSLYKPFPCSVATMIQSKPWLSHSKDRLPYLMDKLLSSGQGFIHLLNNQCQVFGLSIPIPISTVSVSFKTFLLWIHSKNRHQGKCLLSLIEIYLILLHIFKWIWPLQVNRKVTHSLHNLLHAKNNILPTSSKKF